MHRSLLETPKAMNRGHGHIWYRNSYGHQGDSYFEARNITSNASLPFVQDAKFAQAHLQRKTSYIKTREMIKSRGWGNQTANKGLRGKRAGVQAAGSPFHTR